MTEFNDDDHWALFLKDSNLGSGERVRWSELTLAALRSAGVLDNMEDGTSAPATNKLWLDKNSDPAVLKEYDTLNSAWLPATFDRIFGRAIVTPLTVASGDANSIAVTAPANFIDQRLYTIVPPETSTGNVAITVPGYGTFPVRYSNGADLAEGELPAGYQITLLFSGGRFNVLFATAVDNAVRDAAVAARDAAIVARDQAQGYRLAASNDADRSEDEADRSEGEADRAESAAALAQDEVLAAIAGFTGFDDNQAYDYGSITNEVTYFDRDYGSISD
jgi:hypothetical protein